MTDVLAEIIRELTETDKNKLVISEEGVLWTKSMETP